MGEGREGEVYQVDSPNCRLRHWLIAISALFICAVVAAGLWELVADRFARDRIRGSVLRLVRDMGDVTVEKSLVASADEPDCIVWDERDRTVISRLLRGKKVATVRVRRNGEEGTRYDDVVRYIVIVSGTGSSGSAFSIEIVLADIGDDGAFTVWFIKF